MQTTIRNQFQPCFYPQQASEQSQSHRHSSRRPSASAVSTKSSKSLRDRRRSSGATSTHSQHKPKKYIGDYIVGKTLGKGASGRVKLGVHKHSGEQVAIKIISKTHLAANPAVEKAVRREIAIMKLIHHPNVMSLIDVIDDASSPELYLILEYVQGGELFEYLVSRGRLSESEARHHFQQIILGLDYCHRHLICHRDLKPENLLLNSENNIKIADFGMASLQPIGSLLETSCGSPHYASPEIVAGMRYQGSACDIWSCGVILYALLTGHLPFDDENIRQLLKKVRSGRYVMPDNISRSAQDLIQRILVVDPSKRINMQQIMSHSWFTEVEPLNLNTLPIPPTEKEIGQPVAHASEIDDRLLETIKFLWGETEDQAVIDALVQKEHNMQKVVYVLLQQHANRYWQAEHNDESDEDNCTDYPQRQYHTLGRKSIRNRKHLSVTNNAVSETPSSTIPTPRRAVNPWISDTELTISRRQSTATLGSEKGLVDMTYSSPPLPSLALKPEKMTKSETFYSKFVKTVLSPSRKQNHQSQDPLYRSNRHTEDNLSKEEHPTSPTPNSKLMSSTWMGTLRRKNPFQKPAMNTNDLTVGIDSSREQLQPSKSATHRINSTTEIQRNKVDPTLSEEVASPRKSVTLNAKKLSLHFSNTFRNDENTRKSGFTFNNTRKQRKQLDMSIFQSERNTNLPPPPALLSDESTLSSSSSTSSSNHSSYCQTPQKTLTKTNNKQPISTHTRRRLSQASFKSIGRRESNLTVTSPPTSHPTHRNRPVTPSLLSNSSTITTPSMALTASSSHQDQQKPSWIQNLFFFKQPKVCSLVVYSTNANDILKTLHRLMNLTLEARFYEKFDRTSGKRYKADIRTRPDKDGKTRQVKCRIELVMTDLELSTCVVQLTQQQGDGVLLSLVVRQLQEDIVKEFPFFPSSNSFLVSESFKKTALHDDFRL